MADAEVGYRFGIRTRRRLRSVSSGGGSMLFVLPGSPVTSPYDKWSSRRAIARTAVPLSPRMESGAKPRNSRGSLRTVELSV